MYGEKPDTLRVHSRKESSRLGGSSFLVALLVPKASGMGTLDALPAASQLVWLSRKQSGKARPPHGETLRSPRGEL